MLHSSIIMKFLLVILACVDATINPIGPLHQRYATECILNALDEYFDISGMVSLFHIESETSPGYEIQSLMQKLVHQKQNWSFQVTTGELKTFRSFQLCTNCDNPDEVPEYKSYFFPVMKPTYYVILIEGLADLKFGVRKLRELENFNVRAEYFVYYLGYADNYRRTAQEVLLFLHKHMLFRSVLLIPESPEVFYLYGMDLYSERAEFCALEPQFLRLNRCFRGTFSGQVYKGKSDYVNLNNCSIMAVAMKTPPYVINADDGLEIDILEVFAAKLNITFRTKMTDNAESWGKLKNRTWINPLGQIYDLEYFLGVGGVYKTVDRVKSFDYSVSYDTERMVWVAPAPELVPRWKVLIVLFKWQLWVLLIVTFVLIGWCIYFLSVCGCDEFSFLKVTSAAIIMSFQITVTTSVKTQPKSANVRIVFIHMALSSIIISCYYQSSLINVLTDPRYEPEMSGIEEAIDSGLGVGGMDYFRSIYNDSEDEVSARIYKMYQSSADKNDTMARWLQQVASERKIATILGKFYVQYLINRKTFWLTNPLDYTSKVYILPGTIYREPVQLVYTKGFPLIEAFDKIIGGLIHGGIIHKSTMDYLSRVSQSVLEKLENTDEEIQSDQVENQLEEPLELLDLQSAFALLLVGAVSGFVFFVLELVVYYTSKSTWYRKLRKRYHGRRQTQDKPVRHPQLKRTKDVRGRERLRRRKEIVFLH